MDSQDSQDSRDKVRISGDEIIAEDLDDWRLLAQALHARFRTGSFLAGVRFAQAVGEAAEAVNHHPDLKLTYPFVDASLVSHDVGCVTRRDVALARRISEIARAQGVAAEPGAVAQVELALDTAAPSAQGPFWAALLTGDAEAVHGDDVVDPGGRVPLLWFQPSAQSPAAGPQQRFHLDVWVPHDVAENRIALALDNGGTLVDEDSAPTFTVLADPEGNRVCVCTSVDR
ncbi:MAG: 4a-hydroxytetrahydrobiopterin dehydratase [Mycobacteriaceae bacterium]